MQTKNLFGIFLLFFWAFSFMECSKDDKIEDGWKLLKCIFLLKQAPPITPWGNAVCGNSIPL